MAQPGPFSLSVLNAKKYLYFVEAQHEKGAAWYYIQVNPAKLALFKKHLGKSGMVIADYGKILLSGWGAGPSPWMRKGIEQMLESSGQ